MIFFLFHIEKTLARTQVDVIIRDDKQSINMLVMVLKMQKPCRVFLLKSFTKYFYRQCKSCAKVRE